MAGFISFRPGIAALRKACGGSPPDLGMAVADRWTIAPPMRTHVPAAHFLPGQFERLRGVAFGTRDEVVRSLRGDYDCDQPATLGYRLRHVDLIDGVLYGGGGTRHLRSRSRRLPAYRPPAEVTSGALYESWNGNRWFGCWLSDDCLSYGLAHRFGAPVATGRAATGHAPDYAARLGLTPRHVGRVHFDELILFDDLAQNAHKARRADAVRARLAGPAPRQRHPGVFLLRGRGGEERRLTNEHAIADRLARTRGFAVIDPSASDVAAIVDACAGADVVAGVEGSHLVHGLTTMPPDAALLVIQPPDRVVSALKMTTDRQGQAYAFVIGEGDCDGFTAAPDEVERTLDLVAR